jgi:hypothetical protein
VKLRDRERRAGGEDDEADDCCRSRAARPLGRLPGVFMAGELRLDVCPGKNRHAEDCELAGGLFGNQTIAD